MAEQRNRRGVRELVREGDELAAGGRVVALRRGFDQLNSQLQASDQYPNMPPEEAEFVDQFKSQFQAREANRARARRADEGRRRADAAVRSNRRPFHSEGATVSAAQNLWESGGQLAQQLGAVATAAVTPPPQEQTVRLPQSGEGMEVDPNAVRRSEDQKAADDLARRRRGFTPPSVPALPQQMMDRQRQQQEEAARRAALRPTRVTFLNVDDLTAPGSVMTVPFPTDAITGGGEGRGILPGEEQATSMDTFRALPADIQQGVRSRFEASGSAENMPFEDWMSETFAEYPPDERADLMRQIATAAPRMQAGKVPLPPGMMSDTAIDRVKARLPLPEGRELDHYTPDQRRAMGRNVFAPDARMTPFGGTFGYNVDGSLSMRAPDPEQLAIAQAIAADPTQGRASDSWTVAMAQALGFDVTAYGNDMPLLRAHVEAALDLHAPIAENFDAVPSPMGGYRYRPNKESKDRARDRATQTMADNMALRYGGMEGYDRERLDAAANAGNRDELVRMNRTLNRTLMEQRRLASRDRAANYGLTQDLNNPRRARGMMVRGLMAALNDNDPMAAAGQAMVMGNDDMAARFVNQAGMAGAQQAAIEQARIAADEQQRAKDAADPQRQQRNQLAAIRAAAQTSVPEALELARQYVAAYAKQEGRPPLPPEEVTRQARILVAVQQLQADASDANIDAVFAQFADDEASFMELAARLNIPPDQARARLHKMRGSPARRAGAAIPQALGDFAQGVADAWSGLWSGDPDG